jgi:hypothetical protein
MDHRLPFLGGPLPPGFRRWTVSYAPYSSTPFVEDEWRDAFVVVVRGAMEVECLNGGSRTFAAGAMIWLTGLSLKTIHNRGAEPVVVVAVTRCAATDESAAVASS